MKSQLVLTRTSFSSGQQPTPNNISQPVDSELWCICPGTPMTVTQYRRVRTVQTSVTIENFSILSR